MTSLVRWRSAYRKSCSRERLVELVRSVDPRVHRWWGHVIYRRPSPFFGRPILYIQNAYTPPFSTSGMAIWWCHWCAVCGWRRRSSVFSCRPTSRRSCNLHILHTRISTMQYAIFALLLSLSLPHSFIRVIYMCFSTVPNQQEAGMRPTSPCSHLLRSEAAGIEFL